MTHTAVFRYDPRAVHGCPRPDVWAAAPDGNWSCPDCAATWQVEQDWVETREWAMTTAPTRVPLPPPVPERSRCYTNGAFKVHVHPGCRCDVRWTW